MGNVIEFPKKADQNWIALERDLRKILLRGGASPEQADVVLSRMKADFDQPFDGAVHLAPPFPAAMSQAEIDAVMASIGTTLRQRFQEILYGQILREILIRQAELYGELFRRGKLP